MSKSKRRRLSVGLCHFQVFTCSTIEFEIPASNLGLLQSLLPGLFREMFGKNLQRGYNAWEKRHVY